MQTGTYNNKAGCEAEDMVSGVETLSKSSRERYRRDPQTAWPQPAAAKGHCLSTATFLLLEAHAVLVCASF